jgi:RNA polymerase sigma factor (sigma-70 family)
MPSAAESLALTVTSALTGEAGAWERLVRRFERMLCEIGRDFRLSAADVDDAMQTTWMRMFRYLHAIRDPEALPAWLATTMRRECLRMLQAPVREVLTAEVPEADPAAVPDALGHVIAAERRETLMEALVALPPRQRELMMTLIFEPSLPYEEIARRLGMPVGSIGPTRARSVARLQRDSRVLRLCA